MADTSNDLESVSLYNCDTYCARDVPINRIGDREGDQVDGCRYAFHINNGHKRSVNRLVCMANMSTSYEKPFGSLQTNRKTLSYENPYDCACKYCYWC